MHILAHGLFSNGGSNMPEPITPFVPLSIETSLFDMFECGPGPSSSHTIGPMKAGLDFLRLCQTLAQASDTGLPDEARRFKVELFGSLSATGAGHGTHAAVIAGLLGYMPAECPAGLLASVVAQPETEYTVHFGHRRIHLSLADVLYGPVIHDFPFSNTLHISLVDAQGDALFMQEYYSVGGGFLQWKGYTQPERGKPVHPYHNMRQIREILRLTGLTLHELILENESAITGMSRPVIQEKLDTIIENMLAGVSRGFDAEGVLPGSLRVQRKARALRTKAVSMPLRSDRFLANINAYAFATSEENAAGGVIVTAPTCGAAGVLPSLLYSLRHDLLVGDRAMREGLLAAACVGFLAKHNAAIAGAEVGCQGEVGVASAMAAAMLAHARGESAQTVENAAEIALEHHLGLTCDPVDGLVQIPCIERNAMGAVKAYNAYLLATSENPAHHRVTLDSAIEAMAETGREMNAKFKETSLGGLAVSMVNC